mmetsp:Transcript_3118/g.10885  ORF Transcript_3118/g.10885 Transcript_3118/m.10885 type:complete len:286 (+) Transcript_3118:980-1837(+)
MFGGGAGARERPAEGAGREGVQQPALGRLWPHEPPPGGRREGRGRRRRAAAARHGLLLAELLRQPRGSRGRSRGAGAGGEGGQGQGQGAAAAAPFPLQPLGEACDAARVGLWRVPTRGSLRQLYRGAAIRAPQPERGGAQGAALRRGWHCSQGQRRGGAAGAGRGGARLPLGGGVQVLVGEGLHAAQVHRLPGGQDRQGDARRRDRARQPRRQHDRARHPPQHPLHRVQLDRGGQHHCRRAERRYHPQDHWPREQEACEGLCREAARLHLPLLQADHPRARQAGH